MGTLWLLQFRSDEIVTHRIPLNDVGYIRGVHVIGGRVYFVSFGSSRFDGGAGLWSLEPSALQPQPLLSYKQHSLSGLSLTGPGEFFLRDSIVFTRRDGTLLQYDPESGNLSPWDRPGELQPGELFLTPDGALMAGLSPAGEILSFDADAVIVRRVSGLEPCSRGYMDIQDDWILLQCFDKSRRGDLTIWKREAHSAVMLPVETALIRALSPVTCSLLVDGAGGGWVAVANSIPEGVVLADLRSGSTQWTDGRWLPGPFIDDGLARKLLGRHGAVLPP